MNIQIFTCQFGSGHLSAAQTIQQQLSVTHPEASVQLVDLVTLSFPRTHRFIYKTYQHMVLTGAKVVRLVYGESPQRPLADKPSPLDQVMLNNLFSHLDSSQPQVCIATYSLASKALAYYKKSHPDAFTLVTCITDVEAHRGWMNHETDLYLVACQSTKDELLAFGVSQEKIIIQGIPVADSLESSKSSRHQHILLMGGGFGLLPSSETFYYELAKTGARVSVVCAKNTKLKRKLDKLNLPNMRVYGYCQDMKSLLREADLIISKPGGVTTFEAIAAEIPFLAFSPTLPQERSNARFIEANQLGVVLPKALNQVPQAISELLTKPEELASYRQNMRTFREGLDTSGLPNYLRKQPCS